MITDVAQAIMTRYNDASAESVTLRAGLTGGLWFTQAKDDVVFPYAVFQWVGSNIDEIAGDRTNGIETATITVNIYSNKDNGGVQIFNLTQQMIEVFDWTELTYPGGSELSHISFSRISIVNHGIVGKIWDMELDYECKYSH